MSLKILNPIPHDIQGVTKTCDLYCLHVSEHSEHFFLLLFLVGKINYFHGWEVPPSPPFAENSAKIMNLIFEPFPNWKFKITGRIGGFSYYLHLQQWFHIFQGFNPGGGKYYCYLCWLGFEHSEMLLHHIKRWPIQEIVPSCIMSYLCQIWTHHTGKEEGGLWSVSEACSQDIWEDECES